MKLQHFLLTALILFCGVGGVYATKHYVGFTAQSTHTNLQEALAAAEANGDTVCVATGLYLAENDEFIVSEGVTVIGGYDKGSITAPRHYPGEFIPFTTSDLSTTSQFTVLDGNSYKSTLPAQKHRVIRVEKDGVVDGCLIRNGHVRNKNGGGVLLNGGKLYNSIVRGNVAMSHPDSAEALGGGVFIQDGGALINCLVAYNMANDGYGVAAGTGGGKMINNTITANTYAPVFAKISAGTYRMYQGTTGTVNYRPGTIAKWTYDITLTEFYISRTKTTEGQYAVFCAAMDITKAGTGTITGQLNMTTLKGLTDPFKGSGTTLEDRYKFNGVTGPQDILQANTNKLEPGLSYADGVWYPTDDTASVEYPMGYVTWFGSLAYSVWLGGGLPTEAQWEYAARREPNGSVNDNFYSGAYGTTSSTPTDTWRILDTIAWVDASVSIDTVDNSLDASDRWTSRPHEVARKRPNAMGIYDMTGSSSDWCADWLNAGEAVSPYATSTDPIYNNPANNFRSFRSSGHYKETNPARFPLNFRNYTGPANLQSFYGFRPVVKF